MIINEKGKLFGKISLIDLLVILIIIGAVAGCCYKFFGGNETVSITQKDTFTVVLRVEGVKSFFEDAVNVGEVVYEQHGNKLGTITEISTEPYQKMVGDDNPRYLTFDDRNFVYLTLECTGTVNSGGYYIGGNNQIYNGNTIYIQSRLFKATGKVMDIQSEE